MDLYISSLVLGAAGLGTMAIGGLGLRVGGGRGAQASHGHAGHSTGPALAHGHGAGHAGHAAHVSHVGNAAPASPAAHLPTALRGTRDAATNALWTIASPRFLFSIALGFGAAGELLNHLLGGPFLMAAAAGGAVLFERALVTPLWNFSMRFASSPAVTLESSVTDDATAVTSFDTNGQGIVSVEVDGQIVQILATLRPEDRQLGPVRVRRGQQLRIEQVDAEQNRCTVSLL